MDDIDEKVKFYEWALTDDQILLRDKWIIDSMAYYMYWSDIQDYLD